MNWNLLRQPQSMEERLQQLYGTELDDIFTITTGDRLTPALQTVDAAPMDDRVGPAIALLMYETRSGALIPPELLGADVVWCRLLLRLARHDLAMAARMSSALAMHLFRARYAEEEPHAVVEAVVHYIAAALLSLNGQRARARRRWMEAAIITELEEDDRPGISMATCVRAAKLLAPLIEDIDPMR